MSYRKKYIKSKIHKIKPKKSIFKKPIFLIAILVLVIISAALYFLFFFYGFQVKNIVISGNEKIQLKDIDNLVSNNINKKIVAFGSWSITSKSIFLTNPSELQRIILKTFPTIETATIERQLPQNVNLKIEERKPFAVFCQTETVVAPASAEASAGKRRCFFIDRNGVVFEELQNIPQDMPILKQSIDVPEIFSGENVIEKNIMDVISKIEKNLKDNFQINVKEAFLTSPLRLDIKTNENWQIYFDLNSDTDLQIIKLNSLLKNEISQTSRANLQYIDLRFKDRAYYK